MESALSQGAVLLISEPLVPGGIATYTKSIMSGLTQAGIQHPLVTSVPPTYELLSEAELDNVQVVSGLFWTFWRPFVFRRLIAWAREQEITLIHGTSALAAPVCAKLAEALEVPFVVTVHHFQKQGTLRPTKYCQGIIAVSDSLRENLVNDAHVPKELIRLIPAGIRIAQDLRPRPASYQLGEGVSIPLVSTFGKLIPRKDFPTFIRAARIIADRFGPNVSFVISGDGPDESTLRHLTRQLGIDKQVTFCHGTAANEELLRDTDVYVQCSKIEGFGTMILQAMAHGVPVVATATGGILSLVKDGESGFLVPVGDHEAIAARVINLLTDAELCHRVGEAAREVAIKDYNLDDMMNATLTLYQDVIGRATETTASARSGLV